MHSVIPTTMAQVEKKQGEIEDLIQGLPKQKCWSQMDLRYYRGTWYPIPVLRSLIFNETNFKAKDTDIILASVPKSGSTWMSALLYSIVNRNNHSVQHTPLLTSNPKDLVPHLELDGQHLDIENMPTPRMFSTHVNYDCLAKSILSSRCKIVYMCRNPLDCFISFWHFASQNQFTGNQPLPVGEAFECVLKGTETFGPFWNHTLSYWNASSKDDEKIFFIKYEELRKHTVSSLKKLADFLGFSFSEEEEKNGVIEEIIELCSLEKLKSLEINKTGERKNALRVKNSTFFRKGEVGDWVNYLTPAMAQRLEKLMEEKFHGSGLSFEFTAAP